MGPFDYDKLFNMSSFRWVLYYFSSSKYAFSSPIKYGNSLTVRVLLIDTVMVCSYLPSYKPWKSEINLCLVYFMENTLGVIKDVNLYVSSSKPYILSIVKPLYKNQCQILISRLNSRNFYSMETFLGEKNHASKCILWLSICLKILSS